MNKKFYWVISFFILLLLIYLFYPSIIKGVIKFKINTLSHKYKVNVEVAKIKVKRNHTIFFEDILCYTHTKSDTILYCKNLMLDVKIVHKMKIDPLLQNLVLNDMLLFLYNYENQHIKTDVKDTSSTDPLQKMNKFLNFFSHFPKQLTAYSIHIETEKDSVINFYTIDTLLIKNDTISGNFSVQNEQQLICWSITGKALPEEHFYSGELQLNQELTKDAKLPFVERLWGVELWFKRLCFSLKIAENRDKTNFNFGGQIEYCNLFHPAIADKEIKIDSASFFWNIELNKKKIELQKGSIFTLNGFSIYPYFLYEKNEDKRIIFELDEKNMDMRKMVTALPKDLFQMITKMGLSGKLDFYLLFDCDFAELESLKFDFLLASKELNISPYGNKMITNLNQDFKYDCMQDDILYMQIEVSENNPKFVKFDDIPFYLMHAILVCEDPSFFRHNGILQKALRESMVTNLKKGEYTRGGSTLSMQFVKNVFLHKKKLITRKIEEILLVLLIEENKLITKERMFEIYVNVIEWAPLVYGLYDAADFYFRKTPDMLNFSECVYLATLIRSPKNYYKTIGDDGKLTEKRRTEMNFITQRMKDREMITEEQLKTFNSFITMDIDSVKVKEWEEWKENREKERKNKK